MFQIFGNLDISKIRQHQHHINHTTKTSRNIECLCSMMLHTETSKEQDFVAPIAYARSYGHLFSGRKINIFFILFSNIAIFVQILVNIYVQGAFF